MTHCRSEKVECRSCWMLGSATFTIVMSSSSMKVPRQTAASVHHFGSADRELSVTDALHTNVLYVAGAGRGRLRVVCTANASSAIDASVVIQSPAPALTRAKSLPAA